MKNHAVRGPLPPSRPQSVLWPNAKTTYPAGSVTPPSLCPQQRDFLRKSLKSVLRPVARYEDSQRESRAARRSWLGLVSLECFRGGVLRAVGVAVVCCGVDVGHETLRFEFKETASV